MSRQRNLVRLVQEMRETDEGERGGEIAGKIGMV